MGKAFRLIQPIQGKEPVLRRIVCEVRYQDGQLYLDHCGRLLKQFLGEAPEWVLAPDPAPQGTTLHNLRTDTQLRFSMSSASLSLDRLADKGIEEEEVSEFVQQTEQVLGLVLDELEISQFLRFGYRESYHFPFDTKEESEKWLRELGVVTVVPSFYEAFGAILDTLAVAIVVQGEDCRYRIGLNGIERPALIPVGETVLGVQASTAPRNQRKLLLETLKKDRKRQVNTAFAIVVDIDAFLLEPETVDIRSFVQQHAGTCLQRFREALPKKESPKKGK